MIGFGEVMLDFLLAEISAVRLERPENPFKIMPPFGRYDGGRRDGIVVPAILRKHIGRGSAQPPGQGRAVRFPRGNVRPQRQQPFKQREGSVRLLRGGIFCKEDPAVRCKLRIMAAAAYRGHNRNVQNGHAPIVAAGGRVFHEIDIRALVDQVVRNLKIVRFYRDLQRRLAVVLFRRLFRGAVNKLRLLFDEPPDLFKIAASYGFESNLHFTIPRVCIIQSAQPTVPGRGARWNASRRARRFGLYGSGGLRPALFAAAVGVKSVAGRRHAIFTAVRFGDTQLRCELLLAGIRHVKGRRYAVLPPRRRPVRVSARGFHKYNRAASFPSQAFATHKGGGMPSSRRRPVRVSARGLGDTQPRCKIPSAGIRHAKGWRHAVLPPRRRTVRASARGFHKYNRAASFPSQAFAAHKRAACDFHHSAVWGYATALQASARMPSSRRASFYIRSSTIRTIFSAPSRGMQACCASSIRAAALPS